MLSFPMYEDFRDDFVDRGSGAARSRRVSLPLSRMGADAEDLLGHVRAAADRDERRRGRSRPSACRANSSPAPTSRCSASARRSDASSRRTTTSRGDGQVAVLSYDYWRNRYGADPSIVGQTITVNNNTLTVIGVSQAGFTASTSDRATSIRSFRCSLKAQITPNWDDMDNRRSRWVNVFGAPEARRHAASRRRRRCSRTSTASSSRKCRTRRSAARPRTRANSS